MKIMQAYIMKVGIVLGFFGIQALWLPGTGVFAAQPSQVLVTNGKTNPVEVKGIVNIGITPYQHTGNVRDSSVCAPQCILHYQQVPQGQRLVITHVSAQLGATADIVVLEGGNGVLFVTKPYKGATFLSTPVTFYYEAGQTPTARMAIDQPNESNSLVVTIIGYVVPSQ